MPGIGAGFVVGRPVDRAALQEAVADAVALDDDGRTRRGDVRAGAGVRHAERVEPGDRREDRGLAVVHVVGDADGGDAGARSASPPMCGMAKKPSVWKAWPRGGS